MNSVPNAVSYLHKRLNDRFVFWRVACGLLQKAAVLYVIGRGQNSPRKVRILSRGRILDCFGSYCHGQPFQQLFSSCFVFGVWLYARSVVKLFRICCACVVLVYSLFFGGI